MAWEQVAARNAFTAACGDDDEESALDLSAIAALSRYLGLPLLNDLNEEGEAAVAAAVENGARTGLEEFGDVGMVQREQVGSL